MPTDLRRVWSVYLPLALSFELMMLEGPLFHATIGRLAEATRNLRAWGLTMQLSLLIESPIIMLLATSIALNKDARCYSSLRRFTLVLCAACTVIALLISCTPALDRIGAGLLGYPTETVVAARLPMQIMILWSAFIGWRRFCQGLMVRNALTRWVTAGTVLRLGSMAFSCWLLVRGGSMPGATAAAIAMMIGVFAEAVAATFSARPLVRRLPQPSRDAPKLTQREIGRFHAPLAATALISLASGPMVAAALAALPEKERSLAAWPVMFSLLLVMRGWGLAVQETTVGQLRSEGGVDRAVLSRFATRVGLCAALATGALTFGPVLGVIASALSLPSDLVPMVRRGVGLGAILPLITAWVSWSRGVLTADGRTVAVYQGTAISVGMQALLLWLSTRLQWDPMITAASAMLVAECAALAHASWMLKNPGAPPRT